MAANKEGKIEEYLRKAIEERGGMLLKLQPPPRGLPDRLMMMPDTDGRVIFIETKTEEGELSPIQDRTMAKLTELGYPCILIPSLEAAKDFVRDWDGAECPCPSCTRLREIRTAEKRKLH